MARGFGPSLAALLTAALLCAPAGAAMAQTAAPAAEAGTAEDRAAPDLVTVGAGLYDLFDDEKTLAARVEYRFDGSRRLGPFTPFLGFASTGDGATYGYGGFGFELALGERVVLMPNLAAGIYGNGGGKDLGHAVQFRSGLEIAWRFDSGARLGLGFHHLSNASLADRNPGAEILSIIYTIPVDTLFGD